MEPNGISGLLTTSGHDTPACWSYSDLRWSHTPKISSQQRFTAVRASLSQGDAHAGSTRADVQLSAVAEIVALLQAESKVLVMFHRDWCARGCALTTRLTVG
jgi:hypothetical protein